MGGSWGVRVAAGFTGQPVKPAPVGPDPPPVGPEPHLSARAWADQCGFRRPAGETRVTAPARPGTIEA
ncbi:hypothetical protein GCM10009719_33500 [Nocardioides kribbensis]